jgi:hypothetical protein
LWPNVSVEIDRTPGQAQWVGLELIEVAATMETHPRPASVRLARYIRSHSDRDEGGPSR